MKVRLADANGEAVALAGDVLHAVAERAFAPGAPLTMSIDELTVRAKTIGSKKRDDGRYDVRLRLLDLRRADRERLTAMLQG